MATVAVVTCDLCRSTEGVHVLTVGYNGKAWEADVCTTCYTERLKELAKVGRRPRKTTVRPANRFRITPIDPNAL